MEAVGRWPVRHPAKLGWRWGLSVALLLVLVTLALYAHLPYAYVPPFYEPTALEIVLTAGVYAVGGLFFALSARFLPLVELDRSTPVIAGGRS